MTVNALPIGTLTFLFTDIEGSTKLLNALGTDRFNDVLEAHTQALRRAFSKGHEVRVEGDALFVVFATARDALAAAAAGQRALASTVFPHDAVVRVRMGMHTGEGTLASERAGADYVGIDVHRAARIAAVAYGGQVLVSGTTRMLAGADLPPDITLRDLGEHRLKDLRQAEQIFQLVLEDIPNEFPALRTLDRTPNNLPMQLTTFIGREKEIRDGVNLLESSRLLTLVGPGGIGKTRLSLQLAAEAAHAFPDGAFWVPLASISDPELVPSAIATSLGVQVQGNQLPLDRVAEHVRDKTLLLVLDNFEQVLPAATAISVLLAAAPNVKVVTSSRAPLRISGEQEFPIPPLDLPDPERLPSLDVLVRSDAVKLFVERAQAVRPDFSVGAENAAAIAEIVARLDGLPLAIELAAARVKLLSPQAMLPRLKQGLDLLAATARDRTDRQRTLRGAIAWSYDLLDDPLKRLFARGAAFVGGSRLEQVETVCGPASEIGCEVLDGVSELVDQSLMRRVEVVGEPRFRMLVTIHDYALECLERSGERDLLGRRHCAAYVAVAEAAAPHFQGKEQKQWLDAAELEHDNFRAALEYSIAGGHQEDASRLVFALWRFWQARGYLREGRVWADRALALPNASPADRMRMLEAAGGISYWMGDELETRRRYGEAYELAKVSGSPADRAQAPYNYSFTFAVARERRDLPRADALLRESLDEFRALGDRAGIARAAWALGVLRAQGQDRTREELVSAKALVSEALDQHRALNNQFDIGWDLHALGLAEFKLGEQAEAEAHWREAVDIFVAAGDSSGLVILISNFAELAKARGDLARHATLVGAWTAIARRTGAGLGLIVQTNEGRAVFEDIPEADRAELERGLAMNDADVVSYALESSPTRVT